MTVKNSNRGFIALISILIISVILLTAVFSLAYRGIASRFLLLDLEHKVASEKLAEGCVAVGIIAVVNDPSFTTANRAVPVGGGECVLTIRANTSEDLPFVGRSQLEVIASSTGATTNLRVIIDSTTGAVVPGEWHEIP